MGDENRPPDSGLQSTLDRLAEFQAKAENEIAVGEDTVLVSLESKGGLIAWIFKPVLTFFKAQFAAVWNQFWTLFSFTFPGLATMFASTGAFATKEHFESFVDGFVAKGWLDEDDANGLLAIHANAGPFGRIAQVMITLMLSSKIVGAFGDVIGATAIQKMNKTFTPAVPSAGEVLNTAFIAPELWPQVLDVLKRNGYSEDDIKLMMVNRYAVHPPAEVAEMFLRGVIDEKGADNRLSELGYTPERIAEVKQLWKRIPTLQDVVRYLGKEAFEPDQIAKYGLGSEFPEEAVEWAAKQGLDRRWAEAEWIAHWRDPGLQPYLDAYHRELISWSDVNDYMRLIEIPQGHREIIAKTAYNVFTRVDTRRMYQLGILNEEGVFKAYKEMGYDPVKAQFLTAFTVIDVASEDQPLTRADLLSGFRDGDLTQAECEKALVDIGYKPDRASYLVYREQRVKDLAARDQVQKLIHDRYINNFVDENGTRQALFSLGLTTARVSELMTGWTLEVLKGSALPSKTDLDKMYRANIITEKVYLTEMARLGYSETYRQWYLDMIKANIA